MISVTGYKQYKQCPRYWCYKNIVADARVKKDPFRREVTLLARLQTIYAWRGTVVDNILSRYLVNAVNKHRAIDKDFFITQAMTMFTNQLEFAVFQKYRDPGTEITNNPDFNALIECEIGSGITDEEIKNAKGDIISALTNVLEDREFMEYLQSAKNLISQRSLTYNYDRFSVKAKPDLIAFFENDPPHIFDWKVHTYGTVTYDEQLIAYAVALFKVGHIKPHEDFPANLSKYSLYDYKLSEYQLLHKDRIKRDYTITEDQVRDFGDNLGSAIIEMHIAGANKKYKDIDIEAFETTKYVENCTNCAFQKICKTGKHEVYGAKEVRDEHLQY